MSQVLVLSDGIDTDFDKKNDENIKNAPIQEKIKLEINKGTLETGRLLPGEAFTLLTNTININETVATSLDNTVFQELPKQKFERIKNEISDLKEDLDAIAANDSSKNVPGFVSVFKELELLQTLKNILDDESLQILSEQEKIIALRAKNNKLPIQVLFDELHNSKKKSENSEITLNLNSKDDKIRTILIFEDLQRRINFIKSILGDNKTGSLNPMAEIKKYKNISKFLDDNERNNTLERVKKLNAEIDKFLQKRKNYQEVSQGINVNKLQNLNDDYNKIKEQNDQVSNVYDRLESLKSIHEESANLTIKIQTLKETQNALLSKLKTNNELLKKVDNNFTANLNLIKENIGNLDERLKKLGK